VKRRGFIAVWGVGACLLFGGEEAKAATYLSGKRELTDRERNRDRGARELPRQIHKYEVNRFNSLLAPIRVFNQTQFLFFTGNLLFFSGRMSFCKHAEILQFRRQVRGHG